MNIEKQETQTCPDQISDPGRRNNSELGGPGKTGRSPLCHPGVYVRGGSAVVQESRGALKLFFFLSFFFCSALNCVAANITRLAQIQFQLSRFRNWIFFRRLNVSESMTRPVSCDERKALLL